MKAGWQTKKLGDVCTFDKVQGIHLRLPYVGLEHIESQTAQFIGSIEPQPVKSSTFRFSDKHVLYGRLRPYLNKALAPDFEGHCSTEIFPLKPCAELSREYLLFWLLADDTCDRINATCTGARMPRAQMNDVLDFEIPVPPLAEQERIVGVLDAAFAGLATAQAHAEQNLKNARALFDSHLHAVFSHRGPGWVEKPLEECFRLKSGDGLTSKAMNGGRFPVFGGNGIAGMHDEFNLSGDNVIIGRVGALCGNARHITEEIWLTDNAFRIVDSRFEFDGAFLTYLLNFKNLRSFARQAAQPVISNSSLKDLLLPFPKIDKQRQIAAQFDALSAETQRLAGLYEQKLAALAALKKSLLHQAFSGAL